MIEFFVVLIAAALGSFANVLVHRLPLMILASEHDAKMDLVQPASHCPKCHAPLKWWHNIPLLSFIFLRRRCAQCSSLIAWRYFWIELGVVAIGLFCLSFWGLNSSGLAYFVFLYLLWVLAWIDALHFLLPDDLTLLLLWTGLLYQAIYAPQQLADSVFAAVLSYVLLRAVHGLYLWITKRHGIGFGDMKLLAAIGAWLGIVAIANVLIGACVLALLFALCAYVQPKKTCTLILPFGPFLAVSAAAYLVFKIDFGRLLMAFL